MCAFSEVRMYRAPSAHLMDSTEYDEVGVRIFQTELVTRRVQHSEAGELPRPSKMQHGPGGGLVKLIVEWLVALERQRQDGGKQPLHMA